MLSDRLRCRVAWIASVATLALAWQALLPLVAGGLKPRAFTTLCTSVGVRLVPIDDTHSPATQASGDHCALCRIAAAGDVPLPIRAWVVVLFGWNACPADAAAIDTALTEHWVPGSPRGPPAA